MLQSQPAIVIYLHSKRSAVFRVLCVFLRSERENDEKLGKMSLYL